MSLDFSGYALAAESTGLGSDLLRMLARDIPAVLIYGFIGIGMLILGFVVFDKVLPKLDFQVELGEKRNYALAIVLAAFLISVTVIIRGAIAPW